MIKQHIEAIPSRQRIFSSILPHWHFTAWLDSGSDSDALVTVDVVVYARNFNLKVVVRAQQHNGREDHCGKGESFGQT